MVVVVVEVEVDCVGSVGSVIGVVIAEDVDIVVVVVVVVVEVVVEVDLVGCSPSQHVSSDGQVVDGTHCSCAETQNDSPSPQNCSNPPPEQKQYWSVQQAFDKYVPSA